MTARFEEIRQGPIHRIYDRQFRGKWRRCSGRGITQEQSDDAVIKQFGFSRIIRRADSLVVIWDLSQKPPRICGAKEAA